MPASLSTLKMVDNKTKYLIYGYLREIEIKSLNINRMAIDIKNLCILYYFFAEQFKIHGSYLKLKKSTSSELNDTDTVIKHNGWSTVYGEYKIDPTEYKNSIITWTLKIHKMANNIATFGISSTTTKLNGYCFSKRHVGKCYGWYTLGGYFRSNLT